MPLTNVLYHGFQYSTAELLALLSNEEAVGLIFCKRLGGCNERPFEVLPFYLTKKFEFTANIDEAIQPPVNNIWSTFQQADMLSKTAFNPIQDELSERQTCDFEFYDERFELCVFMKHSLLALFSKSKNVIVSGLRLDFGAMAYPFRGNENGIDSSKVFTLKMETAGINFYSSGDLQEQIALNEAGNEAAADQAEDSEEDVVFGTPSVLTGLPCPPYWIPPMSDTIVMPMMKKATNDIKGIPDNMAQAMICNEVDDFAMNQWVDFIVNLGRTLKNRQRRLVSGNGMVTANRSTKPNGNGAVLNGSSPTKNTRNRSAKKVK